MDIRLFPELVNQSSAGEQLLYIISHLVTTTSMIQNIPDHQTDPRPFPSICPIVTSLVATSSIDTPWLKDEPAIQTPLALLNWHHFSPYFPSVSTTMQTSLRHGQRKAADICNTTFAYIGLSLVFSRWLSVSFRKGIVCPASTTLSCASQYSSLPTPSNTSCINSNGSSLCVLIRGTLVLLSHQQ